MKKLILIFLLFSFALQSQPRIVVIKYPNDFWLHYQGSSVLNGLIISSLYYKTNRKWISVLLGTLITNVITIGGKEYIHDEYMGLGVRSDTDIEGDLAGSLKCTFILSMSLINNSRMTKKQIDKTQFENL